MAERMNRLCSLRDASPGMTRADVAAAAGVDLRTVAFWESGAPIPAGQAATLADLCGVSVPWLLGEEGGS